MKKVDDFMHELNEQVDNKFGPFEIFFKKYFVFFSTTFLAFLALLIVFKVVYNKPYYVASVIKEDLASIYKSLEEIDKECNILSIHNRINYIDFLNVEKFSGSTVGCLNLVYPAHWSGPYVKINPTIYGRFYEMIRAKDGFFVVPGNGVRLPNGYVVGHDFDLTQDGVNVSEMLEPGGFLNYKGEPLAIKIKFKIGDWDYILKKKLASDKVTDSITDALDRYNAAIPFTENNQDQVAEVNV